MDINLISPYVRRAVYSIMRPPFQYGQRILFDYQLIYLQGGKCRLTVEGKTYPCRAGQVIFIRPGVVHTIEEEDENTLLVEPHIYFDVIYHKQSERLPVSDRSAQQLTPAEKKMIQPDILSDYPIPPVFFPAEPEVFLTMIHRTIDHFQDNESEGLACRIDVMELLQRLMVQFPRPDSDFSSMLSAIEYVRQRIIRTYLENVTLEELAEQVHMNKNILTYQYKIRYGFTPMQHRQQLRVQHAYRRLSDPGVRISKLAEELHCADIYAFSHFFKRATGLSPMEYRKQLSQTPTRPREED